VVVDLEEEILIAMQERIVKDFLDVLILVQLRKEPKSGYDIISFVHKKLDLLMSPGTIYSCLYSLERDGLIQGHTSNSSKRKRVYTLTDKGERTIQTILSANNKIQQFIASLLSESPQAL
jgi:DNA-binding PadR family transcriptional regulator